MAGTFSSGNECAQRQKMIKKLLSISTLFIIIIILLAILLLNLPKTYAQQAGTSHIVIEANTGKILSSYNKDMKLEMASTTKIATAIVAIENNEDIDKEIAITKEMTGIEGSSIYLHPNEVWTIRELLYGLMLQSGNDAATAIAIGTAGSVDNFVKLMNDKAEDLGLSNTQFDNPHGLHSDNHYTSAYDLARLTAYALHNDTFAKIVSSKSYSLPERGCRQARNIYNKNKLLSSYEGANGVKTGYTTDSGRCFVGAAKRNGMQLVSVVLNCYDMWNKTKCILDKAFDDYVYCKIGDSSKPLELFPLSDETVELRLFGDIYYPVSKNESVDFSYKFRPLDSYPQKLGKGACVGFLDIYQDNRLLFTQKIITINEIKHKGVLLSLMNYVGDWQISYTNGEIEQISGVMRSGVEKRCG